MTDRPTYSKPGVPLAASTSSIFWSIALSALVREIIQSQAIELQYSFLVIPKPTAISILIVLLAFFTLIFVRWLGKIQSWSGETGIFEFGSRTALLVFILLTINQIISIAVIGFQVPPEWGQYASWAIWTWALVPLFVALLPERFWIL